MGDSDEDFDGRGPRDVFTCERTTTRTVDRPVDATVAAAGAGVEGRARRVLFLECSGRFEMWTA